MTDDFARDYKPGMSPEEARAGHAKLAAKEARAAQARTDYLGDDEPRASNGHGAAEPPPVVIRARPFVWREPRKIPPRQWLHAGHYIRAFVSATIAPGGIGKSSLQLVETIGMAAGRDLLLETSGKKKLKVWYWNLDAEVGTSDCHANIPKPNIPPNVRQSQTNIASHLAKPR